jgi:WD40 repeat protein
VRSERRLEFSSDGQFLLTDGDDDRIILWDAKTGKRVRQCDGVAGSAIELLTSADGKFIAVACLKDNNRSVAIWNMTGEAVRKPEATKTIARLAFATEGHTLLAAEAGDAAKGIAPRLRFWNAESGKPLGTVDVQNGVEIYFAAFAPDGHLVVTAGYSSGKGLVQVWSVPK